MTAPLVRQEPIAWMPRERWEALRRGEGCGHCADLASDNEHSSGVWIAELPASRWLLNRVQYLPGFSHVFSRLHASEPYDLPAPERYRYFDEVMDAAQALELALGADKMNIVSHGNGGPHVHFHLKPRFYGDPGGNGPIRPGEQPVRLTPDELAERLALLREALARVRAGEKVPPRKGVASGARSAAESSARLREQADAREWMQRTQWDALRHGDGCTLCEDLRTGRSEGPTGFRVAALRVSELWLHRNQHVPGWCYVVYRGGHVIEPYHLPRDEQHLFLDDIGAAGRALEAVMGATKMNLEMHGNAMPHLHCHIKPRIYGDRWGNRPIYPEGPPRALTDAEYRDLAARIRDTLAMR